MCLLLHCDDEVRPSIEVGLLSGLGRIAISFFATRLLLGAFAWKEERIKWKDVEASRKHRPYLNPPGISWLDTAFQLVKLNSKQAASTNSHQGTKAVACRLLKSTGH